MHVAMVLRQFSPFGGLELYAFQLVKGLLERGISVTVICEKDETGYQHERLKVVNFAAPPAVANKADKIRHYFQAASAAVAGGRLDGPALSPRGRGFVVQGGGEQ